MDHRSPRVLVGLLCGHRLILFLDCFKSTISNAQESKVLQLPQPDPLFQGTIGDNDLDSITPVCPDYKSSFPFTGTIEKITFEILKK